MGKRQLWLLPVLAAVAVLVCACSLHGTTPAAQVPPPAEEEQLPAQTPDPVAPAAEEAPRQEAPEPASAPAEEPEKAPAPAEEAEKRTCTVSVSCAVLLERLDQLETGVRELVPGDGVLLAPTEVELREGESVFDLLQRACREAGVHMEYQETPGYGSAYVEGIGNLYEFDGGALSGWMFRVNGTFPNKGCSSVAAAPGDRVEWVYTCDLGRDVGGGDSGQLGA